jgi:hypothetical protein
MRDQVVDSKEERRSLTQLNMKLSATNRQISAHIVTEKSTIKTSGRISQSSHRQTVIRVAWELVDESSEEVRFLRRQYFL